MKIIISIISAFLTTSAQPRVIDVAPSGFENSKIEASYSYLYANSERIAVGVLVDVDLYVYEYANRQRTNAINMAKAKSISSSQPAKTINFSSKITKVTITDQFLGFLETTATVTVEIEVHAKRDSPLSCVAALGAKL